MPIGKAVLEPKSRKNEGQGHLSQQLGGWCWLEGKGWVIYAVPFGGATEARHSGHLLMCAWSFQREKLPKAKHFIQIQICTEKCSLTKKNSQKPDTDQRGEEALEESWQESAACKITACSFPPALCSEKKELPKRTLKISKRCCSLKTPSHLQEGI